MAGGGSEDNPVPINVVPMVDVIFCLCVFFMCSFQFKQVEGAFDAWLPKGKGPGPTWTEPEEIRVALWWDPIEQCAVRQFGQRLVENDEELAQLIRGALSDWIERDLPDVPLVLDCDARVPWQSAIDVVNLSKALGIDRIEFALGASQAH